MPRRRRSKCAKLSRMPLFTFTNETTKNEQQLLASRCGLSHFSSCAAPSGASSGAFASASCLCAKPVPVQTYLVYDFWIPYAPPGPIRVLSILALKITLSDLVGQGLITTEQSPLAALRYIRARRYPSGTGRYVFATATTLFHTRRLGRYVCCRYLR